MVRLINFLKANEKPFKSWTASLSHIAQVLALILAGVWTYKSFYESERPTLEPHLATEANITWDKVPNSKDQCEAVLDVTVTNTGKRSVEVTAVRITGWLTDIPSGVDHPHFLTETEIEKGDKFFDQTIKSGYLIGHYPPGVQTEDSFTWYFKKRPNKSAFWHLAFTTKQRMDYIAEADNGDFLCNYSSK